MKNQSDNVMALRAYSQELQISETLAPREIASFIETSNERKKGRQSWFKITM